MDQKSIEGSNPSFSASNKKGLPKGALFYYQCEGSPVRTLRSTRVRLTDRGAIRQTGRAPERRSRAARRAACGASRQSRRHRMTLTPKGALFYYQCEGSPVRTLRSTRVRLTDRGAIRQTGRAPERRSRAARRGICAHSGASESVAQRHSIAEQAGNPAATDTHALEAGALARNSVNDETSANAMDIATVAAPVTSNNRSMTPPDHTVA
jgi:hypothetical protein